MKDKPRRPVSLPARIATVAELDALIETLLALRRELSLGEIELVVSGN